MDNKQNKNNPSKGDQNRNDPNRNPNQGQGKMGRDERSGEKIGEGAREGSDVERHIDDDNLGKNSPRGE